MDANGGFRVSLDLLADTHSQSSKEMIERLAEATDGNRALVLGCGSCVDIPVSSLLRRFRRIDFVDCDKGALTELRRRACDAHNEIHYHNADLTGTLTTLRTGAEDIVTRETNAATALDELCRLLTRTPARPWESDVTYDLVVCSAVLTQLQASARRAIEEVFIRSYARHAPLLATHRGWRLSAWRFARMIEDAFVAHLDTLVAADGVIYLSDSVRVAWLTRSDEDTVTTDGVWIATRTACLTDYLSPSAEIIAQDQWTWLRQQQEGPYWGRLYDVQAVAYR